MSDLALYLFKAAGRPLYRKENLYLLAAERGSIVELAYNRVWVAAESFREGAIRRGTPAVVVFTDRPYSLLVPARHAEVADVLHAEETLRLQIRLGGWAGVEGADLADFTRRVKETNPSAPAQKFVVPKLDDARLLDYAGEMEDEGWRRTIDRLLAMSQESHQDPYRTSVFFRPLGVRAAGALRPARVQELEPGAPATLVLRFYNPHLSELDVSDHRLELLAAQDTLRVRGPERFPSIGEVQVELEALGGRPELAVQIGPVPVQHTLIVERFARARPAARPAEAGTGAAPEELLQLYEFVARHARWDSPDARLELLAWFEKLLPDEQRVLEARALLLLGRGSEDAAYAILRELDVERLGDEARLALFRLALVRAPGLSPGRHAVMLDLMAESRFEQFLAELESLDPRVLARLVPELLGHFPEDQLRQVMDRVARRVKTPEALAEIAHCLYVVTGDPGWAYDYLDGRRRTLRLSHAAVTDMLIELSAAGGAIEDPEIAGLAMHRIGYLIELDRLDEARALMKRARDGLSRADRDRLYHRVATRLARKRRPEQAAEVLVELAFAACDSGDLAEATESMERARGLLVRGPGQPMPEWLAEAVHRVEDAWKDCQELVEWRLSEDARRMQVLRERLSNRRILVAGGLRHPEWEDRLRGLTGAEIEWIERLQEEGEELERYAERIRTARYVLVVYRWQKTGQEPAQKLKAVCEAAGIRFAVATTSGLRGVEEAIWQHVGTVAYLEPAGIGHRGAEE
ncbi:MAG: hypothetical protein HY703_06445 [Gemmatimonadetes bacterium]|nr:hypothetical protein [Gemmatimonadota bacterium]